MNRPLAALLIASACAGRLEALPAPRNGEILRPCADCRIYLDAAGTLDLPKALGRLEQFQKNQNPVPNFGFSNQVYFVYFEVFNQAPAQNAILHINYAPLDRISLLIVESGEVMEAGDRVAFSTRPVLHRTPAFPVALPSGEKRSILLRFESQGTMEFPILLMQEAAFRDRIHEEQIVLGLYYGMIIVLIVYNLILFFLVRDPGYFYYLLYVAGYGLIQMILNGLAFEYLWPGAPQWNNISLPFSIGWAFLFGILFARHFLNSKRYAPTMDKILAGLMVLLSLQMPASFLVSYNTAIRASAFLVLLFALSVFLTAVKCVLAGNRAARFFLMAWFSLLLGVSVYSLKGLGVLPSNILTENMLQVGSALEMCLLSLGLGDRLHTMGQEREAARRSELEALQREQQLRLVSARLEIELLKRNLQPHFLLNSLNAASVWLGENPESARRLLEALAEEMRIILDVSSRQWIALETEVALCRAHLDVMGLRQEKSFTLHCQPPQPGEWIPPLVLHTILENGISHGFRTRDTGNFYVTRRREGDTFHFVVTNDGELTSHPGSGTGLRYVRSRLKEASSDHWSLDYGAADVGFEVRFSFRCSLPLLDASDPGRLDLQNGTL